MILEHNGLFFKKNNRIFKKILKKNLDFKIHFSKKKRENFLKIQNKILKISYFFILDHNALKIKII